MTFSLALDRSNGVPDFRIRGGVLVRSYESDAARDRLYMRLRTQLGDWVFDTELGVPYVGEGGIMGGKKSQAEVEALLRRAILSDPEADRVDSMTVTAKGRRVSVEAVVVLALASGKSETVTLTVGA